MDGYAKDLHLVCAGLIVMILMFIFIKYVDKQDSKHNNEPARGFAQIQDALNRTWIKPIGKQR